MKEKSSQTTYFHFPVSRVSQKKETNCRRFESLCHRKDLVQQELRGQIRFLQSFVMKSPFCAVKLMVVFADNEDLGDKQIYMGQQYSLDVTSIDYHCTEISSITKVKTYIIIYILKHVQGLYQQNFLQAVKPCKAGNNNNRKGILQLERRGKFTHSPLNFLATA